MHIMWKEWHGEFLSKLSNRAVCTTITSLWMQILFMFTHWTKYELSTCELDIIITLRTCIIVCTWGQRIWNLFLFLRLWFLLYERSLDSSLKHIIITLCLEKLRLVSLDPSNAALSRTEGSWNFQAVKNCLWRLTHLLSTFMCLPQASSKDSSTGADGSGGKCWGTICCC